MKLTHTPSDGEERMAVQYSAAKETVHGVPGEMETGGEIIPERVSTGVVADVVNQIMRPLLESIGTLLKNNTEAMEQIASSQDVIRNRMEALEKQVRLQTPVTRTQVKYLNDAVRKKARDTIASKDVIVAEDKKAVTKLSGMIRKSVLARYGIGNLQELPRCEYNVAMSQIETWNNAMATYDVVKEARERAAGEQ